MSKKTGVRRSPSTGGAPNMAALRAMERIAAALGRESAGLKQEDAARAAAEKTAIAAYLKGLKRAGAEIARLPSGTGLLSGEDRGTGKRRSPARSAASGSPLTALAGLADIELDPAILPFATLTPPYDYEWTWTKIIYYAPGKLESHAHKATGKFGFDIASSHDSNQVNKCRARAAIGVMYRPTERGVLGIRPKVDVKYSWSLKSNMRAAHTYGWTGMLVQSFRVTDNALASTLIDKKQSEFDMTEDGSLLPAVDVDLNWPPGEEFWGTSLIVHPKRWYAIWIWCGGGIRAAGWQAILGANVGRMPPPRSMSTYQRSRCTSRRWARSPASLRSRIHRAGDCVHLKRKRRRRLTSSAGNIFAMPRDAPMWNRRRVLRALAAAGACAALRPSRGASPAARDPDPPDPVHRRAAAGRRPRQLDHVQRRQRPGRARRLRGRHAQLRRGGRADDRLVADVRIVAGSDRSRAAQGGAGRAHLLRGQGVDLVGRARPRADRAIAPALAGDPIRSRAGPQPAQLAGASADAVRDEGGGTGSLRRHHDVGRSPPSRHRAADAEPPDRLRAGHLQPARSRGRGADPAARTRSRHRGDRESAVPRRRPAPRARAATAARVGRGPRLHELGAARAEVHRLASRRHLRDPGDDQRRARPGEHERRARVACPTRRCASGSIAAVERA